jgi:chromate transporter
MGKTLTPDWPRRAIAVLALFVALVWQNPFAQIVTLAAAGALGAVMLRADSARVADAGAEIRGSRLGSFACVGAYFALLAVLPLCALLPGAAGAAVAVVSAFYRAGALVFGGGHVVLPLLQSAVVTPGWVTGREFVAGYGAAQAVPGPLFTFSAYLGYLLRTPLHGATGAIVALLAIFLPSFLLVAGVLPFWDALRANPRLRSALAGINAAVVGILAAAFYHPVWTNAVFGLMDVAIAAVAFCALVFARVPPWAVALGGAAAAGLLQLSA